MNVTDFKIRANRICDRWYFRQTKTNLEIWERPYIRGPGFEEDYKIMILPLEVLCLGEIKDEILTKRLQRLAWMHSMRQQNKQVEVVKDAMARNDQRQVERDKDMSRETKAFFKDNRKLFAKLGDETGMNSKMAAQALVMKSRPDLSYDDAKKELTRIKGEGR